MKSQIEIVTPELAKLYLQNNDGNRNLRKYWVNDLSEIIKRNEWQITHQGIAFSENGRLLDGQHRLHAIIKANMPVIITVSRGITEEAFKVIDCGMKRTISDLTQMNKKTAEACRQMASLINNARGFTSADQALKVYETGFGKLHDQLIKSTNSNSKIVCSVNSRVAAICLALNGVDFNYIKKVYADLAHSNFQSLPPVGLSFLKQINHGTISASNRSDLLARCLKVFNPIYEHQQSLRISHEDWNLSTTFCKNVVKNLIKEN